MIKIMAYLFMLWVMELAVDGADTAQLVCSYTQHVLSLMCTNRAMYFFS